MATPANEAATVLLVDDHPLMRKGLRALLENERDVTVVGEASDGREAINQVKTLAPNVVVMDITMPHLNGIDATRRILLEAPATRVIALSIHAEKRFVDDMLRAGAAGYVLKDSVPEELVEAIHAVVGGEAFLSAPILRTVISGYQQPAATAPAAAAPSVPEVDTVAVAPLLRTKLHCPATPVDFVLRTALLARLEVERVRPLILVSAPAGYGKSVLISYWLAGGDWPFVWVSLDHGDSDLRQFLSYWVAAVQSAFPQACAHTLSLVNAPQLPSIATLRASLSNELDRLSQPFFLVLDDYHRIDAQSPVHELLHQLLAYPPIPLHLVILTRRDPPLPLLTLRAKDQLTEIRMQDLRFSQAETLALLDKMAGFTPSDEALANVQRELEGWVVGLRLVALAMRHLKKPEKLLKNLYGGIQQTQVYLIQEVVAQQSPAVQNWLLRTAILDRFCGPLCDAVCAVETDTGEGARDGDNFIRSVVDNNLFVIPLDIQGEWFRYHHLFQHLLREELAKHSTPAETAGLHARASEWFERQGLIDEAIKYALAAGDVERTARIVERHWRAAMSQGKWYIVAKWLSQVPETLVQARPELLLAQAWKHYYQYDCASLLVVLDRIDALLGAGSKIHNLSGEVSVFRGFCAFLQNDHARSMEYLEYALDQIGTQDVLFRSIAEHLYGGVGYMQGQREQVTRMLHKWLHNPSGIHPLRETCLLLALLIVDFLAGDLLKAERYLPRTWEVAKSYGLENTLAWCDYYAGIFRLQRGEPIAAISLLTTAVERKYLHYSRGAVDTLAALVLAYQANGEPKQAAATLRSLREFVSELGSPYLLVAESCAVRLALMQAQPKLALRWLGKSVSLASEEMIFWFEVPCVTRCRALIAEGSTASLLEAEGRLQEYAARNEANHNTYQLIVIRMLQAMVCDKQGNVEQACALLEQALTLAQPGGIIFPFLELGAPLADLLMRLPEQDANAAFVERILAAFSAGATHAEETDAKSDQASQTLMESLTPRELDILELLAQRLRNKEIAARLFVSLETVKTHLKHLYQKLAVNNRREAISKATQLLPVARSESAKDIG